jgi:5'-nucleotidase
MYDVCQVYNALQNCPVQLMDMAKRLLLTGDDGYQSLGTRLLVHVLRDLYDVTVVGTVTQQSAVGGKLSLADGFNWGKTEVDGVSAYWIDGTPTDGMEFISCLKDEKFDLTISGVNWGANLGTAVYGSGTVNAAIGSIVRGVTDQAIAVSWDLPSQFYLMRHDVEHSLDEYLEYPGKTLRQVLQQCIENNSWGVELLNINFPQKPTTEYRITKLTQRAKLIYNDEGKEIVGSEGYFTFQKSNRVYMNDIPDEYDVKALTNGFISISPCHVDLLDETQYQKLQSIQLEVK